MLESQRLVYSAITHLMKGDMAPVHAIDSLKTEDGLKKTRAPRSRTTPSSFLTLALRARGGTPRVP